MTQSTKIEMTEDEREILHAGLEVLSPDDPEAYEVLEEMTQRVLDSTLEAGDVDLSFDTQELEMAIAALDIVDPDDFEMEEVASDLVDRMREVHNTLGAESPEM
jgi:hypothetical protein